jgi:hypothetical protein
MAHSRKYPGISVKGLKKKAKILRIAGVPGNNSN